MELFSVFKAIRHCVELTTAKLVFTYPVSERRSAFHLRLFLGYFILLLCGIAFQWLSDSVANVKFIFSLPWLCSMIPDNVLSILYIGICFQLTMEQLLYRNLAAHTTDCIKGVLFYILEDFLFRTVSQEELMFGNPGFFLLYVLVRFALMLGINLIIFKFFSRGWKTEDETSIHMSHLSSVLYASMILLISFTLFMATQLYYSQNEFKYRGLFIEFFVCLLVLIVLYSIRLNNKNRLEAQLMQQLLNDRETQYHLSEQTIDIINHKCHNLKHQIEALKHVSGIERDKSIDEINQSVMIYDSIFKTGKPIVDTILTEKSLLCEKNKINLTCMVKSDAVEILDTVDLYVLLGNALDNAMEHMSVYPPSKRNMSLNIHENDAMLFIEVSNYCETAPIIKEGLPVTTKADKTLHGFGVRSMKAITEKYGGNLCIEYEDQAFTVIIGIPLP